MFTFILYIKFRLLRNVGTNTTSTTAASPLLRVVNHVATELKNNPRLAQDSVRAQDVWARLPAVVSRLCESGMSVLGSQHDAEGKSGGWLCVV